MNVVRAAVRWHPPLMLFAVGMLGLAVVSLGGVVFDDRVLLGAPIWLKPVKFAVSMACYAVSWAWLLSRSGRPRRWMHHLATGVVVALLLEFVIVAGQVIRGRMSHFNRETPLDDALFTTMGITIALVWVCNLVQAVVLLREPRADRALTWAIRGGLVLSLVGMAIAFPMTMPTAEQAAVVQRGFESPVLGAHSVGVSDGGPGLPITGWSTLGGDLRVPHFVGLHALQVLPLLAWALGSVDGGVRARLIVVADLGYGGVLLLLTWQAFRGQSVIAPDGWTCSVGGLLGVAVTAGVLWSLRARRTVQRPEPVLLESTR